MGSIAFSEAIRKYQTSVRDVRTRRLDTNSPCSKNSIQIEHDSSFPGPSQQNEVTEQPGAGDGSIRRQLNTHTRPTRTKAEQETRTP